MLPMEQPKLPESNCLCLFTSEAQGDSGKGERKKENAYAKFLKLKAVMKKVIELDETAFPYCLAIPH